MNKTISFNTSTPSTSISSSDTNSLQPTKEVTWDEDTINLHNLERGTRQKIDEPKTPFSRSFIFTNTNGTTQNTLDNSLQTEQQIPVLNLCAAIDSMDVNYISESGMKDGLGLEKDEWSSNPQLFSEYTPSDIQDRLNGLESEQDQEELKKEKFNLLRKQHYQLKRHSIHSIEDEDMQQDKSEVVKVDDQDVDIGDDEGDSDDKEEEMDC